MNCIVTSGLHATLVHRPSYIRESLCSAKGSREAATFARAKAHGGEWVSTLSRERGW